MKTTRYFEEDILGDKRSYIKREWCEAILRDPEHTEAQENGRIRYWGYIEEIGKYLRVVTLEDGETVDNAMPDRNYTRKQRRDMRLSYHSDTDSLYIHLSENPGADVIELSKDVAVDLDVDGNPVGIDIESNASKIVDLSRLEFNGVSLESLHVASEPKDRRAVS